MKKTNLILGFFFFNALGGSSAFSEECVDKMISLNPSYTSFAYDFVSHLPDYHGGRNSLVSAPSVRMALSLAALGSKGQTWNEFSKVLKLEEPEARAESVAQLLAKSVEELSQNDASGPQIRVVNGLFARQDAHLTSAFKEAIGQTGAEILNVDFNNPETVGTINGWIEKKTNHKIHNMITELNPRDFLVILNATSFDALWEHPFSVYETSKDDFSKLDLTKMTVDMMNMKKNTTVKYYEDDQAQVIRLPYKGNRYGMYVVLPKIGHFEEVQKMSEKYLEDAIPKAQLRSGIISLPRFEYENEYDLIPVFKNMGLVLPFSVGDFSPMIQSAVPVYISQIKHKTFIKVMETGTEAAAATGVTMTARSIPPPPQFMFKANRPFFFAIRDSLYNVNLFQGIVTAP